MRKLLMPYLVGVVGLGIAVGVLLPWRGIFNTTPIALAFLLVVLFTAALYGSYPAFAISVLALLCFNYFFLPPYHTFTIAEPQNWIAFVAFLITAFIAGGLSAREKRRRRENKTFASGSTILLPGHRPGGPFFDVVDDQDGLAGLDGHF